MYAAPLIDRRHLFLSLTFLGIASQAQAVPPRTTQIELQNQTEFTLVMEKEHLDHGDWTPKLGPPAEIKPGAKAMFKSECHGLTGDINGYVHYRIGGPVWHNPFGLTEHKTARAGTGVASTNRGGRDDMEDVFWIAPDGSIKITTFTTKLNRWSVPYSAVPAGAARADSPLVVLSRKRDLMDLFWIGPDGSIRSAFWGAKPGSGWSAQFNIAPANAARAGSSLTAAAKTDKFIDVFWIGPDNSIQTAWWAEAVNKAQWNKHFSIRGPNIARAGSPLSVTARPDELHVFFVSPEDGVSGISWTAKSNQWSPLLQVSGRATVAAGAAGLSALARQASHLDIVWVNRDGGVSHNWADTKGDGGKWHNPTPVAPAKAVRAGSPLSLLSRVNEKMDVFYFTPDGAVGSNWWASNVNKGLWSAPFTIAKAHDARGDSGLSVLARVGNHLDVFWVGGHDGLSSNWWDEKVVEELSISWGNPLIESQYKNTYQEHAPDGYEFSHTGDGQGSHPVVTYALARSKPHAVPGFLPSKNGFQFSNTSWKKIPVVTIDFPKPIGRVKISDASEGMCGGMAYAMIDYFLANQKPGADIMPTREDDPLFKYIKGRLEDSWDPLGRGGDYLKFMRPDYPDTDEGIGAKIGLEKGRSYCLAREEWPKIKADIDGGQLSPLGLVQIKSLNPGDIGKNHQVLAYAYDLSANNVTLHIWDPNEMLNDTVQIKFNIGDLSKKIEISRFVNGQPHPKTINMIFRTNYKRHTPVGGRPK